MIMIQNSIQKTDFHTSFNLADQFEKLFIDTLIYTTRDLK